MTAGTQSEPFFAVRTRLPGSLVATVVVLAAVIVVASSAVAWDGTVPDWEAEPLRWINGWPDWLEPGFWVLQQVGVFMASVVAGVIVVYFTRRLIHLVPFVLVLPSKLTIEKAIVKQLVERERPYVFATRAVSERRARRRSELGDGLEDVELRCPPRRQARGDQAGKSGKDHVEGEHAGRDRQPIDDRVGNGEDRNPAEGQPDQNPEQGTEQ